MPRVFSPNLPDFLPRPLLFLQQPCVSVPLPNPDHLKNFLAIITFYHDSVAAELLMNDLHLCVDGATKISEWVRNSLEFRWRSVESRCKRMQIMQNEGRKEMAFDILVLKSCSLQYTDIYSAL